MSDKPETAELSHWCVLLPCSKEMAWALPQKCLAEIVTLPATGDQPPAKVSWRGRDVPVLDLGDGGSAPWCDIRAGTGLVAILLGLEGGSWSYYGVALRGEGLGMKDLSREDIEDVPEECGEKSVAAFRMGGRIYQVPDLECLEELDNQQCAA